ncbi:MAG: VWA domain-containing protein [Saprospiraceae bacterium]|nr:VWA domain-containing protein [Saprospiraceae bacterium]
MFRFEHIEHLYFLAALLPLAGLLYLARKWYLQQRDLIGDAQLINVQTEVPTPRRDLVHRICILVAMAFLIIAWANPQWGAKREKVKARSTDIFLALDISTSMYCQDIAPNRLEQAKRFSQNLIQYLKGERIGLILFAGNAYLQMPLTTDYAAGQLFIKSASPALAASQGTALEDVLQTASENFEQGKNYQKTLIIISDGEDHDAETVAQAEQIADEGITIFTIGIGTVEGSFIPVRNSSGQTDWKRGVDGQPVRTQLNETLLKAVAEKGGGAYFRLADEERIMSSIKARIDQMEKQEFEERSFTEYESFYQYFLCFGIVFLLCEWILRTNFFVSAKQWVGNH